MSETVASKSRAFRIYHYRDIECGELSTQSLEKAFSLMNCRKRRRAARGITESEVRFYARCQKAVKDCQIGEKPVPCRTMKRNMIVVPQMIGSVVQCYNGQKFVTIDIKPEMIGLYLGEMAVSKRTVNHLKAKSKKSKSFKYQPFN